MENQEKIKETLERISEYCNCPLDDVKNLCRHTDSKTGKTILVSIPED
jgi:hypothetical protein